MEGGQALCNNVLEANCAATWRGLGGSIEQKTEVVGVVCSGSNAIGCVGNLWKSSSLRAFAKHSSRSSLYAV